MKVSALNWIWSHIQIFFFGLLLGAACFFAANSMVRPDFEGFNEYDKRLGVNLGYIYPPLIGIWLGWLQRSWARMLTGAVVGLLMGQFYIMLITLRSYAGSGIPPEYAAFPFLGGVFAALLGSSRYDGPFAVLGRLGKGVLVTFTSAVGYIALINIGMSWMTAALSEQEYEARYIACMRVFGPVAFGVANGVFLVFLRWAVGIFPVRQSEPVETPPERRR